jgi:hypothetical protein
MKNRMRKHLSATGLLEAMRLSFSKVKDPLKEKTKKYELVDCLMSGLAIFSFKSPSLLDFDQNKDSKFVRYNLKHLYGVEKAPCDTQLRERLDEVEPSSINRAYKAGLRAMQRGKALPLFEFLDGYYLISNDGTGVFHSEKVHCENCCVKNHKDGRVSYYHQTMSSVLVHPDQSVVIPLLSEPILKGDGSTKNDCERNAGKRLLEQLRTMHPQLKMLVVEDGLHSNAPHIKLLKELKYRYIIGVKPKDHKWLFDWVNVGSCETLTTRRENRTYHFRWFNDAPLNESNEDIRVNFFECIEITVDKKGNEKRQLFTWVTDIVITKDNVYQLMRGGRARWKVENEAFNTLKNQGYRFEHNFGHGYKYLSSVFTHLMLLAFMVDQIQQLCCPYFSKALKKCFNKRRLWERMRWLMYGCYIECWEALFTAIADPPDLYLRLDTS